MIIPVDYAQVNLQWTWTASAQKAEVAFGVQLVDPSDTPEDVANHVQNAYTVNTMASLQVAKLSLTNIHVKFGPNDVGAAFDLPSSIVGTAAGEGLAPNSALLITKNTAFGGRKGRGRMYWPGIQDGTIDDYGLVTVASFASYQTKFTAFLSSLVGSNIPMVVLHGTNPPLPYLVTSLAVQHLMGTQRRRLGR